MAISTPFQGSGEFIPEIVWSCAIHDRPEYEHECDCEHCMIPAMAECCMDASWAERLDENGDVVMRELSTEDVAWRRMWVAQAAASAKAAAIFMEAQNSSGEARIEWVEDATVPIIRSASG